MLLGIIVLPNQHNMDQAGDDEEYDDFDPNFVAPVRCNLH